MIAQRGEEWVVRAIRSPFTDNVMLSFGKRAEFNGFEVVTFATQSIKQGEVEPMHARLGLTDEMAGALVTELWNAGYRPLGVPFEASKGEAQQQHIADLQKIAHRAVEAVTTIALRSAE